MICERCSAKRWKPPFGAGGRGRADVSVRPPCARAARGEDAARSPGVRPDRPVLARANGHRLARRERFGFAAPSPSFRPCPRAGAAASTSASAWRPWPTRRRRNADREHKRQCEPGQRERSARRSPPTEMHLSPLSSSGFSGDSGAPKGCDPISLSRSRQGRRARRLVTVMCPAFRGKKARLRYRRARFTSTVRFVVVCLGGQRPAHRQSCRGRRRLRQTRIEAGFRSARSRSRVARPPTSRGSRPASAFRPFSCCASSRTGISVDVEYLARGDDASAAVTDPLAEAELELRLGDVGASERHFSAVASDVEATDRQRGRASAGLGQIAFGKGDSNGAIKAFEQALALWLGRGRGPGARGQSRPRVRDDEPVRPGSRALRALLRRGAAAARPDPDGPLRRAPGEHPRRHGRIRPRRGAAGRRARAERRRRRPAHERALVVDPVAATHAPEPAGARREVRPPRARHDDAD